MKKRKQKSDLQFNEKFEIISAKSFGNNLKLRPKATHLGSHLNLKNKCYFIYDFTPLRNLVNKK